MFTDLEQSYLIGVIDKSISNLKDALPNLSDEPMLELANKSEMLFLRILRDKIVNAPHLYKCSL